MEDGTRLYTWKHGRQLATMAKGGTTWSYTYDANGMRKTKNTGTFNYTYTYVGSKLTQMTFLTSEVFYFTYDPQGHPATVKWNNHLYYYITNLQGDVIAIADQGNVVVEYKYDAWGKILSVTGPDAQMIGALNPLRYRGYVYDQETGLYYLQSRYYNPEWGRFLNADAYASTGQGTLGNNMFAYCNNNPVNAKDPKGYALVMVSISDDPMKNLFPELSGGVIFAAGAASSSTTVNLTAEKKAVKNFFNKVGNAIATGAEFIWDAYMRGYNLQQNAQMQEAQMMLDGAMQIYGFLDETEAIAVGMVGYHSVQAAREGRKALAYLALPMPTPVDEALALGHMAKGLYHWLKSAWEVIAWSQEG